MRDPQSSPLRAHRYAVFFSLGRCEVGGQGDRETVLFCLIHLFARIPLLVLSCSEGGRSAVHLLAGIPLLVSSRLGNARCMDT